MKIKDEIAYRKLPGRTRARGFLSVGAERGVLLLAEDHLLHLRTVAYSETCKRFALRDIQALVVTRTNRGKIDLGILAGLLTLAALLAVLAFFSENWAPGAPVLWCVAGVFAFWALVYAALGPTSAACLYTAVQAEPLPSLGRLRSALRTAEILRAVIEEVQGPLTGELLSQDLPVVVAGGARQPVSERTARRDTTLLPGETGRFHLAFFALLLVMAASSALDLFAYSEVKHALDLLVFCVMLILGAVALARQRKYFVPVALRRLTVVTLVVAIALFIVLSMLASLYTFGTALLGGDPSKLDIEALGEDLANTPAGQVGNVVQAVVYGCLSLAGLLTLRGMRRAAAAPEDVETEEPSSDGEEPR